MKQFLQASLAAGLLVALAGCQTPPPANQGRTGGRLDPTHDAPSEVGSLGLRSAELVNATDRMARDIAARPDINSPDSPPRFWVGRIENNTSRPERDYQIFLQRLRAQLLASGERYGLDIRRERDFVEMQRAREFGHDDPERSPRSYRSANEYVLTCIVSDLPSSGTNYYLLEYQLVQMVDRADTGPDVGAGAIVWSNFYEVKFQ